MIVLIILINALLLVWSFDELSKNNSSISFVFLSFWSAIWLGVCAIKSLSNFILKGFEQSVFESHRGKVLYRDSKRTPLVWERERSKNRTRISDLPRPILFSSLAVAVVQDMAAASFVPKSCWF